MAPPVLELTDAERRRLLLCSSGEMAVHVGCFAAVAFDGGFSRGVAGLSASTMSLTDSRYSGVLRRLLSGFVCGVLEELPVKMDRGFIERTEGERRSHREPFPAQRAESGKLPSLSLVDKALAREDAVTAVRLDLDARITHASR
jgi:hypothetical protein